MAHEQNGTGKRTREEETKKAVSALLELYNHPTKNQHWSNVALRSTT